MAGRDLFHALRVSSPSVTDSAPAEAVNSNATYAHRVDVGWAAWRANADPAIASRVTRWAFRLKLWRHFGHAQFLVQVDDSYHTATSIRICQQPIQGHLDILLIQTASIWQCLHGLWLRRRGKPKPTWRKHLTGREVLILRYPTTTPDAASLPDVTPLGYPPCAEVLLDSQHTSSLPLRISSSS